MSTNVDWSAGLNRKYTLGADITFTFTDPATVGSVCQLELVQDGTGGRKITLPAGVVQMSRAMQVDPRAGSVTILTFYYGGSSTYYGWSSGSRWRMGNRTTTATALTSLWPSIPSVPAKTLRNDGDLIRVTAAGNAAAQACTLAILYGSSTFYSQSIAAGTFVRVQIEIARNNGHLSQAAYSLASVNSVMTLGVVTAAEDTDLALNVDVQAKSNVAGGTFTLDYACVEANPE